MKKTCVVTLAVIMVLLVVRCSENENSLYPGIPDDVLRTDSVDRAAPVIVENKDSLPFRKYIYLTIDDAPLNGSGYIDSVILCSQVKTNLFVIGKTLNESHRFLNYYNKFRKNPYIEIYNHSFSHAHNKYENFYKNSESVLEDFEKNQSELNISAKIARLPGRNLWCIGEKKKNFRQSGSGSAELLAQNGYEIFGWDVEWKYDAKDYAPKQSIDELVQEIEDAYAASNKTFTSNHVVLLMHDQMFGKVNEKNDLAGLITRLKENGFTFEYLSAYPIIQN